MLKIEAEQDLEQLRDHFAEIAMQSFLNVRLNIPEREEVTPSGAIIRHFNKINVDVIAKDAYLLADAMLKAREARDE